MSTPSDEERVRQLEQRLAALQKQNAPAKSHQDEHYSQANVAWRMVTELVAGLGIGFCVGMGLDALTGWRPVFLVLFTLLGFVAGVKTMMRTATDIQSNKKAAEAAKSDDGPESRRE